MNAAHPLTTTLPLRTFADAIGWTARKVESKIERGAWREGEQFVYDPDGEIHIIIEGYEGWVRSGQGSKRERRVSKSGSTTAANDVGSDYPGAPRRPTWIAPPGSGVKSPRRLT